MIIRVWAEREDFFSEVTVSEWSTETNRWEIVLYAVHGPVQNPEEARLLAIETLTVNTDS